MPGYYEKITRVKSGAKPIDNVTKFAWRDDDYEVVEEWHEYTKEEFEMLEAPSLEDIIAEQDDAICALYEMIEGGK